VEYHAIELEVCIEADGPVGAVEGEGDVGELCPALLLQKSGEDRISEVSISGQTKDDLPVKPAGRTSQQKT